MAKEKEEVKQLSDEERKKLTNDMYKRFLTAQQGKSHLIKKWQDIDMFDRAEMWKDKPIPPWITKPNINLIRFVRTMKRANLALNIPKPHFTSVTMEDTDFIDSLQMAHDHVWEEEKVDRIVRRCVDLSLLYGTQLAWVICEDETKGSYYGDDPELSQYGKLYRGQIKIKRVKVGNFFIDPDADCLEEAKYCEITEVMPLSSVKNNPFFKSYVGKRMKELTNQYLETFEEANGDIFNRANKKSNSPNNLKKDDMVTVHIHFERFRNENGKWQLDVTYYIGGTDFILQRLEDVQPSCYPFAVLYDEEEENEFWGTSTAMEILENQMIVSRAKQAAATTVTMHQNPQKIVSRESGINPEELSRTGTLAGKVWQTNVDPKNSVVIMETPDIPKGNKELTDDLIALTKDFAGINEAYTGESVGSLTTSTGVSDLIGRATLRDKDKTLQINDFVEKLSDLIVKFIIIHWQDERPMMRTNSDQEQERGVYQPVKSKNGSNFDLDNLHYRVKVDIYAVSPASQEARKSQADKLMQIQAQTQANPPYIIPEEWIDLQDFPNKKKMIQRIKDDREKLQQQETQNAQQQIMQVMELSKQMEAQGINPDQINATISQSIGELLQNILSTGASQTSQPSTGVSTNSPLPSGGSKGQANSNMMAGM